MPRISRSILFSPPGNFLALGFGSGLLPFAPGTFGSLAAVPIILITAHFGLMVMSLATLLACICGIKLCADAADSLGAHDHPAIVWDEIAGMMITMLLVPINAKTLLIGFILFRIFDIFKPWPIRWIDKNLQGGVGIMMDDIAAGVVCCVMLAVLQRLHYLS